MNLPKNSARNAGNSRYDIRSSKPINKVWINLWDAGRSCGYPLPPQNMGLIEIRVINYGNARSNIRCCKNMLLGNKGIINYWSARRNVCGCKNMLLFKKGKANIYWICRKALRAYNMVLGNRRSSKRRVARIEAFTNKNMRLILLMRFLSLGFLMLNLSLITGDLEL